MSKNFLIRTEVFPDARYNFYLNCILPMIDKSSISEDARMVFNFINMCRDEHIKIANQLSATYKVAGDKKTLEVIYKDGEEVITMLKLSQVYDN